MACLIVKFIFSHQNQTMKRRQFIQNTAMMSLGLSFFSSLFSSCGKEDLLNDLEVNFNGKVLIIGAGAAGLTAGHILNKHNIDFQIIEASSVFGGRMKKLEGFVDFPIDLGAEWIHTEPSILAELLNEPETNANIDLISYTPETYYLWNNGKLRKRNFFSSFYYGEYKFKSTTWYDFFADFIVPKISDKIVYNSPVNEIDYSSDKTIVRTVNGIVYEADKVLVTVPTPILKNQFISFLPEFPADKISALEGIYIPPIFKVFIEFSEKFYPDILIIGGLGAALGTTEENLYYDVAFRKEANSHVLGLFSIGEPAEKYVNMASEEEIFQAIMDELDEAFDGKASATYKQHFIQDWNKEPYIQGSYTHFEANETRTIETLRTPLNNKVYFAGEALTLNSSTATVHGAGMSAYEVLEELLKNP